MNSYILGLRTLLAFLLGIKPRASSKFTPVPEFFKSPWGNISLSLYPNATKSVAIISADFEMAWAWRYAINKAACANEIGLRERHNIPLLLEILDSSKVPVTWATVGHLFLESCLCDRQHSLPHPELPRPPYFTNRNWSYTSGDWFDHDPCTDFRKNPAWYAPDLLRMIRNSPIDHEIACHSFSHINMTNGICPDEVAEAELDLCLHLAEDFGIELRSMVFPGGTRGHFNMLKDKGFTSYRGRPENKLELNYPIRREFGLWELPTAIMIGGSLSRGILRPAASWILKQYLTIAANKNLVTHFWFHPSFSHTSLRHIFPSLIREIKEMRYNGEICVLTMKRLTDYLETYSKTRIEIEEGNFIVNNKTQLPFESVPITVVFDNDNIDAVISHTGVRMPIKRNNGSSYVNVSPNYYNIALTVVERNCT